MWETLQTYGRKYSDQKRLKLSFLAIKLSAMSGANPIPLITLRTPSHVFHRQGLEEWVKIPVARCAKLIETYPIPLAAKGVYTKY
jgi:hypothetical protein